MPFNKPRASTRIWLHRRSKKPNGLDCSGFISWALKNARFDPGDIGAGDSAYPYQMTKLGEFVSLTPELIKSGKSELVI